MSYASFHKNNDIDALKQKFDKLNGKRTFDHGLDDTYWTPKHVAGPDGVGEAVLRFLPAAPQFDESGEISGQEPDNIVKFFQFSTRKNGKSYINKGRNSLGHDEADPANDYNKSIWARKDLTKDEKKKILVNRNEYYIANVYVVKDPNKPENQGKVFRYQFGRQIYNMIQAQLFPEFETDPKVNVFDPVEGADFILRVTHKNIPDSFTGEIKKVPTYEHSKFAAPSQRWDISEFDSVWRQQYPLQTEVAEDKFRSYDDLKAQFDRVMGNDNSQPVQQNTSTSTNEFKTKKQEVEPERSFSEELNDEIPWDTDDSSDKSADTSSADTNEIDDWFSNLDK